MLSRMSHNCTSYLFSVWLNRYATHLPTWPFKAGLVVPDAMNEVSTLQLSAPSRATSSPEPRALGLAFLRVAAINNWLRWAGHFGPVHFHAWQLWWVTSDPGLLMASAKAAGPASTSLLPLLYQLPSYPFYRCWSWGYSLIKTSERNWGSTFWRLQPVTYHEGNTRLPECWVEI